jgi:hypothetical protein
MAMIAGVAACCACSTLATYQETNKAMLAARERTNQTEPQKKFDWEENSARLRKLASSAQETDTDY